MRRRALLASLGAIGLAGCVDSPATGSDSPTQKSTPTRPATSATPTPAGTPPNSGIPPNDSDCPAGDVDRVVCVPEIDPESVPIALTADKRSGSLPATFEFTLANDTDATLSINFYDWRLWKRVDGEWFHIVPQAVQEPLMRLPPGESHDWTLTVEHELQAESHSMYLSWEDAGTATGLGGGEYAFTTDGWFGEYDEGETRFGFGVLLSFDAPEVTLEPTDSVTGSSRNGDTVTVQGKGDDTEDARFAELALTRVDDADEGTPSGSQTSSDDATDPQKLIPETAAQDYRLRNTLPFFEPGVERVQYVAESATWPAFGVNEPHTVSYGGELFEVTAKEIETVTATETENP